MADTAMGVLAMVMARGLLTLRLTHTMAMVDMGGMALAMADTAMGVLAMVMARGLLTLRLTHTTAMVDMDLDMALAMGDTAMVVLATVMARGPLMPSLTMVDTATWDKECQRLLQGTATNGICSIFRIMKNY